MTLLDRDTLVDRPELIDRGSDEEEELDEQDFEKTQKDSAEVEEVEVQTLGDGGGPTINNIEFEPGDYDVASASNTIAIIASGEEKGDMFEFSFMSSAIQLKQLKEEGHNLDKLTEFGLMHGVAEAGFSSETIEMLREVDDDSEDEGGDEEVSNEDIMEAFEDVEEDTDSTDIEELEEDVEKVKEGEDSETQTNEETAQG